MPENNDFYQKEVGGHEEIDDDMEIDDGSFDEIIRKVEGGDLLKIIDDAFTTDRPKLILKYYYGLDGNRSYTDKEISEMEYFTGEGGANGIRSHRIRALKTLAKKIRRIPEYKDLFNN